MSRPTSISAATAARVADDVDPEPLVALVALRSAQELVAETSRHCNSVDVTLAGGERLAITVSGEGRDTFTIFHPSVRTTSSASRTASFTSGWASSK